MSLSNVYQARREQATHSKYYHHADRPHGNCVEGGPKLRKELSRPGDERIVSQVREALAATRYRSLQNLEVYCDHGRVTLQGRLPTWYLKQLAQSAAQSVTGIRDIDNDIRVSSFP